MKTLLIITALVIVAALVVAVIEELSGKNHKFLKEVLTIASFSLIFWDVMCVMC